MQRRIVSLWFPHLAAERALRSDRTRDSTRPFVVVAKQKSALRLCSINAAAEAAGIKQGASLTDMRAIFPDLACVDEAPEQDRAFLDALLRWGVRYTPWASVDAPDGLILDITGSAHLFGTEAQMLSEIIRKLGKSGLTVRAGVADTKGAAWALARFAQRPTVALTGQTREAVSPLPVAALRIEEDTVLGLNRLGLRTIGDIAGMPRGSLARRFGAALMRRLDQMFGAEPEPVDPSMPTTPYAVRMPLPEPIGKTDDVVAALRRLLDRLCTRLEQDQQGARQVRLSIQRTDHTEETVEIRLARPSHDPDRITKLFEYGIESLDAGFGIDAVRVHAFVTEPLVPEQGVSFSHPSKDDDALSDVIARIGNRIGFERVTRFLSAESHVPERAFTIAAAAYSSPECFAISPFRPVTLFAPEPVEIIAGEKPPCAFRWRRTAFETKHAIGPERIAPEWWWDDPNWRTGPRDYWRVQTEQGHRLWLFQIHGSTLPGGDPHTEWFMHGEFA